MFKSDRRKAALIFLVLVVIAAGAQFLATTIQQDSGRVRVSNATYLNTNGIPIRAKLLVPAFLEEEEKAPGVVYVHGYQNNRETSDPYAIELARRGVVVLSIDAIGRGNSGIPGDPDAPDFDETYGARTSLDYLRSLPMVDAERTGLMGHSLGAEMVYTIALEDKDVRAIVISGFGYRTDASTDRPANMLMILGKYDEYRDRMTGTRDFENEWMASEETMAVFPVKDPVMGETYGNFENGTARRVVMLPITHVQESHSEEAVAEAVEWMRQALQPDPAFWVPAGEQIWLIKEYATFVAMLSAIFSILPLGFLLLHTSAFESLQGKGEGEYVCEKPSTFRHAAINGVLMLLYLPLILVIFGFHVYVLPIDKAFPMMMVNGTVFWFVVINIIGFSIFKRWAKKKNVSWKDLGISQARNGFRFNWARVGKSLLLAALLFGFVAALEHRLEAMWLVDFRFIFPFASDFTPYRFLMFLLYLPLLLVGFIQMGIFLNGQLRPAPKSTWFRSFLNRTGRGYLAMLLPLLIHLALQYIPLFTTGLIPFVGPGGALVGFVINLVHIMIVLVMMIPVSTFFYQVTGDIYTGAFLNALLVAWMFTTSSVIAPIPV